MSSFKFIHTADLHLDSPFRGLTHIPEHIYKSIQISTFSAFDKIIDYCIEYNVDFLLISGDIFDTDERSIKAEIYFSKGLERLNQQGINVYIIHGNHDPVNKIKSKFNWPENVYSFSAKKVENFSFYKENEEVARIYGRSYPTKAFLENIVPDYLVKKADNVFNIGLLHTNVDGNKEHGSYAPTTLSELKNTDIDYWALGHIHKAGILLDKAPMIVYSGTPQGGNIKETGDKSCLLVEVEKSNIKKTKWLNTSRIIWEQLDIDISGVETTDQVIKLIEEEIDVVFSKTELPMIIRIKLVGRTDYDIHKGNKVQDIFESLNEQYSDQNKWLLIESIKVKTKPTISIEGMLEQDSFIADFFKQFELAKATDFDNSNYLEIGKDLFNNSSIKKHLPPLTGDDLTDIYEQIKNIAYEYLLEEEES